MVRRSLVILAIAALIALLANGWVADRSTRVLSHAGGWVEHSYQVLEAVAQLRGGIAEADTGARGFAITGNTTFRAEFERARLTVEQTLTRLKRLSIDNEHQQRALESIEPVLKERFELLHSLVALRDRNAADANIEVTVLNGALLTRSVRAGLTDIRIEELRLLTARRAQVARARNWAIWGPWVMMMIALVMFVSLLAQVWIALRSEIRARQQLEQAIAEEKIARRRAEETDRLKDEFLATLSHELRTPLTSMVGWSTLLEDPQHAPELLQQGIRSIGEAARVQTRLIEDLLDISRIVTGKLHIVLAPVNLAAVIREAVASVTPSAQARDITIRTILDDRCAGVLGDAARLQQVVWNLLTNAVKFTQKGGHIKVLLRCVESHVEISVVDDGEGIEAEFLPHVFDRFRQADSSATRRAGGLGIGLSIVKSLAEAHGGAVRVESAGPGMGSSFHIELPIIGAETGDRSVPLPEWRSNKIDTITPDLVRSVEPTGLLAARTIVAIDDDPKTLQLLSTMLDLAGARVLTATNTIDAIALLESHAPDLIICDIGMPGEDGLGFIRRLRTMATSYAQMPAIALTAFARSDDRVSALSAGFNAYLGKPVTREELVIACASLLRLIPERRRQVAEPQPVN